MNVSTEKVALTIDPLLFRKQALLSSGACFLVSMMYLEADFPCGCKIGTMALIASVLYLLFYLSFNLLYSKVRTKVGVLLSGIAITMLAFVVHFSGGVASPFVFLYFILLISEAVYGLHNSFTLPLAILTYSFVCAGEAVGWLPPANPWAAAVYKSNVVTFILMAVTVTFMWITRYITGIIVLNLRTSLEAENLEKQGLLTKFSDLNSTAQLGMLTHRIVHDLRNPISSISGYIQLEMLRTKDPDHREMLKDIDEIVDDMSESLKNITQFGRVSGGPAEKILLAEFMRMLIAIVSYSPQALGIKFVKLYPENTDLAVYASRSDLQQAFFNIIRNAIEALRDKAGCKQIEISMKAADREVEVSFSDNGTGMPPEMLKNIFRNPVTTKKDGTGVGLMITRELLARNDGAIEFYNLPAGGLWVRTRFPLA